MQQYFLHIHTTYYCMREVASDKITFFLPPLLLNPNQLTNLARHSMLAKLFQKSSCAYVEVGFPSYFYKSQQLFDKSLSHGTALCSRRCATCDLQEVRSTESAGFFCVHMSHWAIRSFSFSLQPIWNVWSTWLPWESNGSIWIWYQANTVFRPVCSSGRGNAI